ncbi:hypothetical protein SK128_024973 [Halocaridina rubra]|uniref:Uncharacterized protein n=1 Tax=Halocaridina rubra TaxID=373956 RepID=A0AAN9AAH0_HALRR
MRVPSATLTNEGAICNTEKVPFAALKNEGAICNTEKVPYATLKNEGAIWNTEKVPFTTLKNEGAICDTEKANLTPLSANDFHQEALPNKYGKGAQLNHVVEKISKRRMTSEDKTKKMRITPKSKIPLGTKQPPISRGSNLRYQTQDKINFDEDRKPRALLRHEHPWCPRDRALPAYEPTKRDGGVKC